MFDKTMQNNYNIFTVGLYEFEWDPAKNEEKSYRERNSGS